MVTIKDIAKACGVSPATVSKALNNAPDVSRETAERIRQMAKAMHYLPNSAARTLKNNVSNNIGVVFQDDAMSGLTHEFFNRILNASKNELEGLGYDIVTFSNHNELTVHPFDQALQVNVYEQGYSPFKFHKLVFGSQKVIHWDPLLPLLTSQMQFELDYLGKGSDFIQINHPYRTTGLTKTDMEKLSGYEIMELDTHVSTQNEYWDQALSAGHYSFGLANDDLHHARNPHLIAIRCNFLCTPSARYEDIKHTLLTGCYYAMRVPDYGNGDWDVKRKENHDLPAISWIGVEGDTIRMTLTERADSIRINGQEHATLKLEKDTDSIRDVLGADVPYARLTAYFPDGEVIYSSVKYVHQKDAHVHKAVAEALELPLLSF